MHSSPRLRALRWALTAATVFVFFVAISSIWRSYSWDSGSDGKRETWVFVQGGRFGYMRFDYPPRFAQRRRGGFGVPRNAQPLWEWGYTNDFSTGIGTGTKVSQYYAPAWPLMALCLLPTAYLWWKWLRRPGVGSCPWCGYSREGVGAGLSYPECARHITGEVLPPASAEIAGANRSERVRFRGPQTRRTLVAAALCLVAGAGASLLVAMGFAMWGTISTGYAGWALKKGGRFEGNYLPRPSDWVSRALPGATSVLCQACWGWGLEDAQVSDSSSIGWLHRAGFPFSALEYRGVGDLRSVYPVSASGRAAPTWAVRTLYYERNRAPWPCRAGTTLPMVLVRPPLPLRPVPGGLLLDSLLYAGVLFSAYSMRWRALKPVGRLFRRS